MSSQHLSRRQFALLAGGGVLARQAAQAQSGQVTARHVIERIQKDLGIPWNNTTYRDTFKAGNPDAPVTGIATTFMSTLDVLQRSSRAGKNLVITHEPTFWSDADVTKNLTDDAMYKFKMNFVEKNNLVVWRFHDHWHARKPDGIFLGWNKALKWEKYLSGDNQKLYIMPPTTLEAVTQEVKTNLQSDSIRVIGDPQLKVTRVGRGSHALAGNMEVLPDVDVLLVSEAREVDSIEWMRDTVLSGQKKGMILIAHEKGEEAGMDECAKWLRTFISEVPIEFISSGEPFWRPA